ncbi:MAG: type II toxin-antitoxin system HicB family antitoxin [Planctomycetes bacterium]|nr:type II toxin-antitoxin system HicB family antitoxin [Planctomycetota bacterium]
MEIPVLLEAMKDNGYRATALAPAPLVAEAATREEVLEQVRNLVKQRYANAELVQLRVPLPGEPHPWKNVAGTWKDHPDAAEFEQNLRDYRRQVDSDPDRP